MKSLHACEIVRVGGCLTCRQGNSLPSPGQAIRAPASSSVNHLSHACPQPLRCPMIGQRKGSDGVTRRLRFPSPWRLPLA